jgi:hypothetical protein
MLGHLTPASSNESTQPFEQRENVTKEMVNLCSLSARKPRPAPPLRPLSIMNFAADDLELASQISAHNDDKVVAL